MIFNNMERYNPLVSIYTGKINKDEAEMDQVHLLKNLVGFNNRSRPKTTEGKDKKKISENVYSLYEGRELILNAFKSEIFPLKATNGKGIKILTPKQMLQRLPIALA